MSSLFVSHDYPNKPYVDVGIDLLVWPAIGKSCNCSNLDEKESSITLKVALVFATIMGLYFLPYLTASLFALSLASLGLKVYRCSTKEVKTEIETVHKGTEWKLRQYCGYVADRNFSEAVKMLKENPSFLELPEEKFYGIFTSWVPQKGPIKGSREFFEMVLPGRLVSYLNGSIEAEIKLHPREIDPEEIAKEIPPAMFGEALKYFFKWSLKLENTTTPTFNDLLKADIAARLLEIEDEVVKKLPLNPHPDIKHNHDDFRTIRSLHRILAWLREESPDYKKIYEEVNKIESSSVDERYFNELRSIAFYGGRVKSGSYLLFLDFKQNPEDSVPKRVIMGQLKEISALLSPQTRK